MKDIFNFTNETASLKKCIKRNPALLNELEKSPEKFRY